MSTISLGLLSWRAHETLVKTLSTYSQLREMVDEAVIYFNDITDSDREIAAKYGFRAAGSGANLGILGGTLGLARELKGDYVLLVQNDNPVNVPAEVLKERLGNAVALLDSGEAAMVRLRDRFDPSFSDECKYLKMYPGEDGKDSIALKLRRILRPLKARRMAGRAPAALKRPDLRHPAIFTLARGTFITDSRFTNYSDQPFIAPRPLVMELLEYADANKEGTRTLNGRYVPEIVINGPDWRRRKLKVAISEGIFAHARYDDSFRPGNAGYNPAISVHE
ncbi:MAG: hypothetical protein J6W80_05280 [Kiritimatiellae bacterium]|nr:hypothetical protein [Kiritimatiellia bacterium]